MENNEKIICMCNDVTESEIIDAIKNHECDTVDKVGEETEAGTVYGGCKCLIENIIKNNN
jgi:NAD(P)H-nitrite reductase large subunit